MKHLRVFVLLAALFGGLGGCTSSLHGSFVTSSYADPATMSSAALLGEVEGRSCQVRVLYVIAAGTPATTDRAIADAIRQYPDTSFLADISIDDEVNWYFPYSVQCIVARAFAWQ